MDELFSRNWQTIAKIADFANIVNRRALSPNLPFFSSRALLDLSALFGQKWPVDIFSIEWINVKNGNCFIWLIMLPKLHHMRNSETSRKYSCLALGEHALCALFSGPLRLGRGGVTGSLTHCCLLELDAYSSCNCQVDELDHLINLTWVTLKSGMCFIKWQDGPFSPAKISHYNPLRSNEDEKCFSEAALIPSIKSSSLLYRTNPRGPTRVYFWDFPDTFELSLCTTNSCPSRMLPFSFFFIMPSPVWRLSSFISLLKVPHDFLFLSAMLFCYG